MLNALTGLALRRSKAGVKSYKMADGGGLFLLVTPTGAKYWRFRYRWAGKEKLLSLGVYPEISLAEARQSRDVMRAQLRDGLDPSAERAAAKTGRLDQPTDTFADLVHEWMDHQASEWSATHADKVRCRLEKHVLPELGRLPLGSIGLCEVLACLRKVETLGVLDTARRVRSHVSCAFKFGMGTGRCMQNPASDLGGVLKTPVGQSFPSITDPARIGQLLRAIERYEGWFSTKALLRLSPMLFQRPGEIREMAWAELDLDAGIWTVPASRMKRRKAGKIKGDDHVVPLAGQAVSILHDLQLMSGAHPFVFPSLSKPHAPLSANTISKALEKMGFKGELVPHGFRHMASTLLHEQGWPDEAIERQLAHVDHNRVRRTYNQAKYLPERARMMQAWADYLVTLRDGPVSFESAA